MIIRSAFHALGMTGKKAPKPGSIIRYPEGVLEFDTRAAAFNHVERKLKTKRGRDGEEAGVGHKDESRVKFVDAFEL